MEIFMHYPFKDRIVTAIKWNKNHRSLFWHRNKYSFCRPGRKMAQAWGKANHTFKHLDKVW